MDRTKTVKFNMNDEMERQLYEWLARLPHGEFTERTKDLWREQMKKEKGERDNAS